MEVQETSGKTIEVYTDRGERVTFDNAVYYEVDSGEGLSIINDEELPIAHFRSSEWRYVRVLDANADA